MLIDLEGELRFSSERYVTKIIHDSEKMRAVLFCLEPGQKVEPHTSPSEVVMFVARGAGRMTVGSETTPVKEGSLAVCPPHEPHGFEAEGRMVVLAAIIPRP